MARISLPAAINEVAARDPVLAWKLDPPPTARELAPLGDRFRPYRSVVARYCWAAVPLFRRGGTDPALR